MLSTFNINNKRLAVETRLAGRFYAYYIKFMREAQMSLTNQTPESQVQGLLNELPVTMIKWTT